MTRALALIPVLLLLVLGCGSVEPLRPYIESERGIILIVGPDYRRYLAADDTLDVRLRDATYRLLDSWEEGLGAMEELLGEEEE